MFFVGVLKVSDENRKIRIHQSAARTRIRTKMPQIRNTGFDTDLFFPGGLASCTPTPGKNYWALKGQCHEIFCFWFFSCINFPPAPEYPIRAVLNVFENSRRYSLVKVCHRYQRHRRQILRPVSLVLLIPVANNGHNIRLLRPYSELEVKNLSLGQLYFPKVSKLNI